jgi:Cu(I)/Ag(I) efflux system membrane fusion protein
MRDVRVTARRNGSLLKNSSWLILLLLLIAGAFSAGSWYSRPWAVTPGAQQAKEAIGQADPTHAGQQPPGIAVASATPTEPAHVHRGPAHPGRATVAVTVERQKLVGVHVSPVERAAGAQALRTFGRVAPDETRVYRLNAGIDGFIREVSTVTTGSQVKKDQLLATFFAPNSIQIIQQYIGVLAARDHARKSAAEGSVEAQTAPLAALNLQQRVAQLRNLGMSALQMEEIGRTRQVPESITIVAPIDGFVLARNVSPDLRFDRGAEWYRIADLRRVWILADVFENDAQYLRPGVRAQVFLPNQRKPLPARVAEVLPQFDPATRTLKVRLEADNPGYFLRADMFVDVELPVTLPPTISVPVDAVLDSGLKKTVFVERAEGVFEPRQVETGWRFGDRVEIVKGLTPGERIVTAGAFLLDSESRMRPAAVGVDGSAGKPKTAHSVDELAAHGPAAHSHAGH